jgi:hypothetical protein
MSHIVHAYPPLITIIAYLSKQMEAKVLYLCFRMVETTELLSKLQRILCPRPGRARPKWCRGEGLVASKH